MNADSPWRGLRVPEFPAPFSAHWRHLAQQQLSPIACVYELLERIANSQQTPSVMKGSPNLGALRAHAARDLIDLLGSDSDEWPGGISARAIARAHTLAASNLKDSEAFSLYWNLVAHSNREAIASARSSLRGRVVLHMTCVSRVARARASVVSFGAEHAASHILLVGSNESSSFAFDAATGVLSVPTADTYEHLPSKVIAACFFLAMCGSIDAVVKIDDDHRLANASHFDALIEAVNPAASVVALQASLGSWSRIVRRFCNALCNPKRARLRRILDVCVRGRRARPVILGVQDTIPFPGAHNRVWHFGKCSNESLNSTAYTSLAVGKFMQGGKGYVLNGYSLSVLAWCWVYFRDQVANGLYEDVTVGHLLDAHGAVFLHAYMRSAVSTVGEY